MLVVLGLALALGGSAQVRLKIHVNYEKVPFWQHEIAGWLADKGYAWDVEVNAFPGPEADRLPYYQEMLKGAAQVRRPHLVRIPTLCLLSSCRAQSGLHGGSCLRM